jgi:hypothetical protein
MREVSERDIIDEGNEEDDGDDGCGRIRDDERRAKDQMMEWEKMTTARDEEERKKLAK